MTIVEFIYKSSSLENICPILLEMIIPGEAYMTCITCFADISYEPLNEWFRIKNNCPKCRSKWPSENSFIYINSNIVLDDLPIISKLNLLSNIEYSNREYPFLLTPEHHQPSNSEYPFLLRPEHHQPSGNVSVNINRLFVRRLFMH